MTLKRSSVPHHPAQFVDRAGIDEARSNSLSRYDEHQHAMLRRLLVATVLSSTSAVFGGTQQTVAPSLAGVLARAGDYTRHLHTQLSGIVAEESYEQDVHSKVDSSFRRGEPSHRTLKSDLLLVKTSAEERYVEFRDVFEVDGEPVRDRRERLTALFLDPSESNRNQLATIIDESARLNIGDIPRNINTPMLTLSFLLPEMQSRFRFRKATQAEPRLNARGVMDTADNAVFRVTTEMWVVEFRETSRPTVIRTNNLRDFPAAGRFWLDPQTGAVLMSELQMSNRSVSAIVNVSYQSEPLLGFLVPAEMRERYESRSLSVDGRAIYGHFRQFQVKTGEAIRKPPAPTR
jgi:hypothetical protein